LQPLFQRKSNKLHILSVFVALGIPHEMRMRRIISSSVTCPALQYFPTLPHKPVAYRGGYLEGSTLPPRNSEVLTKLSRIPSSVENTSVTV
jgi:hypothetical protein